MLDRSSDDCSNLDSDAQMQRDRYRELLEEHRTVNPGVQVLFAFLLTVPFASRFAEIDRIGKIVFAVSLAAVAAATFLFAAPTAHHRVTSRRNRRARLQFGIKTALAGLFLFAVSITCVIFVVVRFLFDSTPLALGFAACSAVLGATLWVVIPLINHHNASRQSG